MCAGAAAQKIFFRDQDFNFCETNFLNNPIQKIFGETFDFYELEKMILVLIKSFIRPKNVIRTNMLHRPISKF